MSLLRNNIDNSINFQRASCTLDGCVKIWTSRVDSVGTETGKLLSNLANEGMIGAEDDEALSDNPDSQDATQAKKKKKSHRPDSTLAKDASQLHSKKLDLEFRVDPLFRKTCADFDEGGAQGLLMNHLSLGVGSDGGMRVVFDGSDSMGRLAEDEEDEEEQEEDVDISYLRSTLKVLLDDTILTIILGQFLPDLDILDDKAISHSLAAFSFAKDSNRTFDDSLYRDDTVDVEVGDENDNDPGFGDYGANDAPMDVDGDRGGQDFFKGDQAVDDDYDGGDAFGGDYGGGEHGSVSAEGDQQHVVRPGGAFVPFDPRRAPNEPDRVIAITDGDGENAMMGYFDKNLMKNWAGPEHWKLRKVVRKREFFMSFICYINGIATAEADAPKARREKKEAFKIDFLTPAEKDIKTIANEMFAKVTRGAGITLPSYGSSKTGKKGRGGRKTKEKRDEHTLPDDMHFSSRQLVTLFLKPKFSVRALIFVRT